MHLEVRDVGFLAESCQADPDTLYRLLRALAIPVQRQSGNSNIGSRLACCVRHGRWQSGRTYLPVHLRSGRV
jgi:hypothetical protein